MTDFDTQALIGAIRGAIRTDEPVYLHAPLFEGRENEYVKDCIDTGWVSTAGAYVTKFEDMLAERCGAAHAVAVVNGTAALHMALLLAGVGPGDEVLVPAMTFVASANAISHCGAVPHFVESAPDTLGIDAAKLRVYLAQMSSEDRARIKAIVPVHVFGFIGDMEGLAALAEEFGLVIVEDAAEALGSTYKGKAPGHFGAMAALSFNGNKIITTGGGGAILTQDPDLAARARHLTVTAKQPHPYEFIHDEVGYNYRMPNINAALGCAQMEKLDGFIDDKRALYERYMSAFGDVSDVEIIAPPEGCLSNYWLNAMRLDKGAPRDDILEALGNAGLHCRPIWRLMHRLPMYEACPRMDLSVAEDLEARIINLPSSVVLGRDL